MKLEPTPYLWFDGALVRWEEARVHVLTHALHYGTSVFEGIRVYETKTGPAVLGLGAHVRRLFDSAKILGLRIPFERNATEKAILELVARNEHRSCYVRPLAFRGYGELGVAARGCPVQLAIATFEWPSLHGESHLEDGVDVGVSSWRRMAPDTHPAMAKIGGNYVNSLLVIEEAHRHGYSEGLVLDVQGYLSEGSGENVFIARDDVVITPPLSGSILPGITRGYVMQICSDLGIEVREERVVREMLYVADEIFMSGTAAEITPVRSVDRTPVGTGSRGPLTHAIQDRFFAVVSGELPDTHGWLTPVAGAE